MSKLLFDAIERGSLSPALTGMVELDADPKQVEQIAGNRAMESLELISVTASVETSSQKKGYVKVTSRFSKTYKDPTNQVLNGTGAASPGHTFYLNSDFRNDLKRVGGNDSESIFFLARLP